MSKHTKAPWRNDDGQIYDADDRQVCDVAPEGIALDEPDEANAKLIAAAPDLLLLAQKSLRLLSRTRHLLPLDQDLTGADENGNDLWMALESAISKATT